LSKKEKKEWNEKLASHSEAAVNIFLSLWLGYVY
jgi:hypothetical protein